MPRKCVYLSTQALELLPQLAEKYGLNESACLSKIIIDASKSKAEDYSALREEMERLRRSENANGKIIMALIEMLNTYFKMFAVGDNEQVFFPVDESPHPWTRKSLEVAESKIRMARYGKVKGGE